MKISSKLHTTFLILVNFLLLHYVVSSIPIRFDMTEGNSFTLSKSAKSLLAKVEEPIRFDFYKMKGGYVAGLIRYFSNIDIKMLSIIMVPFSLTTEFNLESCKKVSPKLLLPISMISSPMAGTMSKFMPNRITSLSVLIMMITKTHL